MDCKSYEFYHWSSLSIFINGDIRVVYYNVLYFVVGVDVLYF